MDASTIARWRMHNLGLWGSEQAAVGDVIRQLSASQGQDFLPALWSMAQRTASGTTYVQACAAFDAGDLLRTHVLRPTWHFVAPGDIRWLLKATAPRVHRLNAPYYRKLGVDDHANLLVRSTVERVLHGRPMTRAEIGAELAAAGLESPVGNRLAYLMMHAELEGWVCSGPRAGNQQTYVLLSERAPATEEISREEALARLARRYFATRGPATVKDLAGWASLTLAEASQARAALGGEFDDLELAGRDYVVAGGPPDPGIAGAVDLIQGLDEIVMSYSDSRDVLAGVPRTSAPPATYFHAILLDGRVLGHWRYDRDARGRPDTIQTFTYRRLTAAEKDAVDEAVQRFATFVGRPVSWRAMSDEQ